MRPVDEVAMAGDTSVAGVPALFAAVLAQGIGSVVEYEQLRRTSRPGLPSLRAAAPVSTLAERVQRLFDGALPDVNTGLQPVEFDMTRIPPQLGWHVGWTAFTKRAEASALSVGFSRTAAAGMAGAIRELADNVIQHSGSHAGVAGFTASENAFEYVVSDPGIGMLASLRQCPEYRSLCDDLEALPLAVRPGISRRGRGYGLGYRAVFAPLAAAQGSVRLRSGAAALEMFGLGPNPDRARCSQRPFYQGVTVTVSVSVR